MLKLRRLQQQKEAQAQKQAEDTPAEGTAAAGSSSSTSEPAPAAAGGTPGGYVLKKTNSKELLETRKSKSKEGVFSLSKGRGKRGEKTKAVVLRVQKDVAEIGSIPGVEVDFPDSNNLMTFYTNITPSDGLYTGATFKFVVNIPETYPYDPPKVECSTLVYHPNIDWEGHVCLNILRADWMPVLNLGSVLFGLVTLFLEPNPDDPLNKEAAQLMIDKPADFERNVKQSLAGGYVLGRQFPKLK
jgi:ubiquitin-conjugating enzyme E2 M